MSKCLDPFRFLLTSLAGWMNQQWPTSPVWPENSIYLKQREIIPGVVDNEMTRCQSAWTRSASC